MSDDKSKTGQQDRILVDVNDPSEVEYLHQQFPDFTHSEIIDAIKSNGPLRKDVVKHLSSMLNKT